MEPEQELKPVSTFNLIFKKKGVAWKNMKVDSRFIGVSGLLQTHEEILEEGQF